MSLLPDPDFLRLKEHLIAATGLAYYLDKDQDLQDRIGRRLARQGVGDYASYLKLLEQTARGPAELDALVTELTIGETYFFRQSEQFEALGRRVLPDLVERNRQSRRLRVWSAGCATGAEPYSVAILLRRECALADWDISILGTDINREFLARAHDGCYEEWALRETPEEIRRACFRPEGKRWVLLPEYRQGVTFQYHNLVRDPFPSLVHNLCAFDLILCRNVVIYFSRAVTRRIAGQLYDCLVDGGWLLMGHADSSPDVFQDFRMCSGEALFQKAAAEAAPPRVAWQPPASAAHLARPEPPPAPAPPAEPDHSLPAIRLLADRAEWDNAAASCRRLIASDGLNPAAHFYCGLVLDQMGQPDAAEQALRRALYLDRAFVLAHYHLGLLLQRGDGRQARRSFENVLDLLARLEPGHVFPGGDGITAGQLKELTKMHLEVLAARW